MDIQTAKQIKIADYLHSLGFSPIKQQGINLWYKSPLREETEASFKVNTERNQWYDFALGKGGNIIALAQELYCSDHVPYLLQRIGEQTPSIRPVSFSFGKQSSSEPSFQQLEIVPLSSPALLTYLQERGINIALAKRECSEAHFAHNGKQYFAIAVPGCLMWEISFGAIQPLKYRLRISYPPDTLGKAMAKYCLPLWAKCASLHSLFASAMFIPLSCK